MTRIAWRRHWTVFAVLQIFLVVIHVVVFSVYTNSGWTAGAAESSGFRPIDDTLSRSPRHFEKKGSEHSPFSQPPGRDTDVAWARLLLGGNMRVTKSELAVYGPDATSVQVLQPPSKPSASIDTSEPQYLAKMGFYHELHCLHKMKRWLYPEAYFPNATGDFLEAERQHLEHCIEWIRTAAVCRGDTTLTLFEWVDGMLETKYPIPHMCVDEGQLLSWSEVQGRRVDIDVDGMIEGP